MKTPSRPLIAAALPLLFACGGGGNGGGPNGPDETRVLVVGVARNDASPRDNLEGTILLFFDIDREILLQAQAQVNGNPVTTVVEVNEGPIYVAAIGVHAGFSYTMSANVTVPEGSVAVSSETVSPPAEPVLDVPETHPLDQDLTVSWEPVPGVTGYNVAAGSGFDADLPATATSATIPASAFAGLGPGGTVEIEVTAYDVFYVSLSAGISGVIDAESFIDRFEAHENVTGARGAYGAASSSGAIVTLE